MTKKWKSYLGGHTVVRIPDAGRATHWQRKRIGRLKYLRKAMGLDGGLREEKNMQAPLQPQRRPRTNKPKKNAKPKNNQSTKPKNNHSTEFRDATRAYGIKRRTRKLPTFVVETRR